MEVNDLFKFSVRGQWDNLMEVYKNNPAAGEAKITKSEDTALHIAVTSGKTDIVSKLAETMGENASNILKIRNKRGNTALHLAAALGNVEMCNCMASKDPTLLVARNKESETPLFSAALHGKKAAFLCLHSFNQQKDSSLCRKSLALQIIHCYPDLVDFLNENGLSPLHILASKSNAFKSSSCLGIFDIILYNCIYVDELSEEEYVPKNSRTKSCLNYPENYRTCIKLFKLIRNSIHVLSGIFVKPQDKLDEENPHQKIVSHGTNLSMKEDKEVRLFPLNCNTIVMLSKLIMKALLVVLGMGIWRISAIRKEKVRHKWANLVMNELVQHASIYKYEDNGQNPASFGPDKDGGTFVVPGIQPVPEYTNLASLGKSTNAVGNSLTGNQDKDDNGEHQSGTEKMDKPILLEVKVAVAEMDRYFDSYPSVLEELNTSQKNFILLTSKKKKKIQQSRRKETPLLIAARTGVTEMVEKILDTFPMAIQDEDCDKKNIVLLAVENRQTHVYELLLKRKTAMDNAFRQLDIQGNSALHLAAKFENVRPSSLIPGAALQMQWETKWYKFVHESMPPDFFDRYNNQGKTPKEIFTETHKHLVEEGSKWLAKTSEACSLVAALIATVAFATSGTVPGGPDEDIGDPIFEREPAFRVFAISSLVALCFSVTALIICLAILTSRYQEEDFAMDLPRKVLVGLTSLFISVVSILISFCSGHYLVVRDELRSAAYPIYAATCLPTTLFALAQVPLYIDLTSAIFRKVPERRCKVF
ncbi:putative Ankyrin repeat-containing protein [Melia azedarach]|uniref:Ankyrin repeat-containing protein n=1 Tax=Melia azedarach TaxID=155640 RepID=A0ACC1YIZ8_MELAZ|nr:putative Ankyrin repeat-containing protein [Melia azedarach]